jgi:hypothetical protein
MYMMKCTEEMNMSNYEEIEIPVVKLQQEELLLYQGKLRARDLLELWDVKRFKEENLTVRGTGYQRQEDESRAQEIEDYVTDCQLPLIPSILVAVRNPKFEQLQPGCGVLKIPRKKGSVFIIDGQHRGMGFDSIRESLDMEKRLAMTLTKDRDKADAKTKILELERLLDFELPTTFVDSEVAAKIAAVKIDKSKTMDNKELTADDVERVFFFVINRTQKSVNPSLKDALQYLIQSGGIEGIPIIAKEKWRTGAVPLVRDLNFNSDSPLRRLINLIGRRGAQEPVKLNTFVSSLKPLIYRNKRFGTELEYGQRLKYLNEYWTVMKELFAGAFDKPREYLLLRSLSVYALNRLANDVFDWCQANGAKVPTRQEIRKYLNPLEDIDWSRNGDMSGLGGHDGAIRAYRILLDKLIKKGIKEAKVSLDRLDQGLRRQVMS